jgi:hypothetical protein
LAGAVFSLPDRKHDPAAVDGTVFEVKPTHTCH